MTVALTEGSGGAGAGLIKQGAGTLTLIANNSYSGTTAVQEGTLAVYGTTGTGDTIVHVTGRLGGYGQVRGNLRSDGHVGPGSSAGTLNVAGNYLQVAGATLDIELGGSSPDLFDVLNITGTATLAGSMNISLINNFTPTPGDLFPILSAADVFGTLALTGQSSGFSLLPTATGMSLYFGDLPPGDYDRNGVVDAADYNVWTAAFGSAADLTADGNHDGTIDAADFIVWRKNVGATVFPAGTGSTNHLANPTVPEPRTAVMAICTALAYLAWSANRCRPTLAV